MNLRQCDGDPCISYRIMKGQTLENKFESSAKRLFKSTFRNLALFVKMILPDE